jgi:hypothetical protein
MAGAVEAFGTPQGELTGPVGSDSVSVMATAGGTGEMDGEGSGPTEIPIEFLGELTCHDWSPPIGRVIGAFRHGSQDAGPNSTVCPWPIKPGPTMGVGDGGAGVDVGGDGRG